MTAKQIRETLVNQCNGDSRMAKDLYRQIQRSLKDERKPLNSIWWLRIVRNDYLEEEVSESSVIHFEMNNIFVETCLSYHNEFNKVSA